MIKGIRLRSLTGLMMGMALSSLVLLAQKPGPPAAGGSSGSTTSRTPPSMPTRTAPPTSGPGSQNLYLSGKVMLDDGSPPPEPVTIERVCNGNPRAQAYTDHKGRFSFQVGQTAAVLQDASEESLGDPGGSRHTPPGIVTGTAAMQAPPPEARMANCDLRAVLPGFRSDVVSLAGRRLMDDPNVGTIILHRLGNVEGAAVSLTSLQAPKNARKAYDRAGQLLRKNKLPEAAQEYQKALEIYPKYAAAWYELGTIQQMNGEIAKARQSFAEAMAADTKFVSPYLPLIELAAKDENWAELADVTGRLLKLDPVDYPMAYFYHATATLNLGQMDAAERSARAGEKLDTQHRSPKLEQVLAVILARKKDYAGAVEHLRSYLLFAPDATDVPRMKIELAELERRAGAGQQANAGTAGKEDAQDGGHPGPP